MTLYFLVFLQMGMPYNVLLESLTEIPLLMLKCLINELTYHNSPRIPNWATVSNSHFEGWGKCKTKTLTIFMMTVSTKKSDASWTSSLSQDNAASYECRTKDTCSPTADTRSYWTPFIFTKDASTDNSQTTLIKTSTSFIRVTSDGACFVPGAWMSGLNLTSNSEIRKKPHVRQKLL